MASITTSSPFVNATAMVGSVWNNKYDLLYNELNGSIDNANVNTTAGVLESKVQFIDGGHDHSSGAPLVLGSISSAGQNKGEIISFNGTVWAAVSTGANATKLKYDFDSNTTLLLHFDNNVTDAVGSPHSITTANVLFSNSIYKFGNYSASFVAANSAYATAADSADWDFGTADFTIDCWGYLNSLPLNGDNVQLVTHYAAASEIGEWIWQIQNSGGTYVMRFVSYTTSYQIYSASFSTLITGAWYHFAVVRSSGVLKFFVNGIQLGVNQTVSETLSGATSKLAIGVQGDTVKTGFWNGYIDELRISKGLARWTTNFTVPTSQYTPGPLWK